MSTTAIDPHAELLAALRLQVEWGADEALDDLPLDRLASGMAEADGRTASLSRPGLQAPARALPAPRRGPGAPYRPGPTPPPAAGPALDPTQATDLAALLAAWADFEGCALRRTAASTVLPLGDPAAPLLFVGEAPDADDDRAGQAFAGPAGRYLDRMLGSIGLTRAGTRFAFLSPWRPPGGRPVSDAELRLCLPFLLRYVALAPPRRLVLLGTPPLRALLGGADGVRRARGRWRDTKVPGLEHAIPALATHPPGQVAANPLLRRDAWSDLLLLRRTLDQDEIATATTADTALK